MKNVKRIVAFAVVIAMMIAFAPEDSGVAFAKKTTKTTAKKTAKKTKKTKFKATKNMTFTDKNVKNLSKALKSKKVKKITLKLKKTKDLTIPKGDYSTKKLIVNSPNTSIVNKATFDTIRIDDIAPDTWTEKGNGNSIYVLSDKAVHIKVDTNRRVASIMFGDEAKANVSGLGDAVKKAVSHVVEMINGALSRLVDASTNEVVMKASGDSSVGSIDIDKAGANMTLSAVGDAHIHNMELSSDAGSPKTKVGVSVDGNATVDTLKTSAEGAKLDVATSGSGAVGTLKIVGGGSATLTGDSTRQSVVDVSEADPTKATVTIENQNAKLETSKGQDVSNIVDNKTGKELDKQVKSDPTQESSSDKPAAGEGKKPGAGGGNGGGAGGGYSGGGGASVSVPADPGNLIKDAGFVSGNYQEYWEGNVLADKGAAGSASLGSGKATFAITNPGTEDFAVQLCQKNITLKHGAKYKLTGKITSDKNKSIGIAFMDPNKDYLWYGGDNMELAAGTTHDIDLEFTVDKATLSDGTVVTCETCNTIQFAISMGKKGTTPDAYTISISNLRLEMVEDAQESAGGSVTVAGEPIRITEHTEWDGSLAYYGEKDIDVTLPTESVSAIDGKELQIPVEITGIEEGQNVEAFIWAMSDSGPGTGWSGEWVAGTSATLATGESSTLKFKLKDYYDYKSQHIYARHFKVRFVGNVAQKDKKITVKFVNATIVGGTTEVTVPDGYSRTATAYSGDIGGYVIDENLTSYCTGLTAGTTNMAGEKMKINLSINKAEGTTDEKQPRVTVIVFSDGWSKNKEIIVPSVTSSAGTYEIEYDFDEYYTEAGEGNHPKYYNLRLWGEGLTYTYKILSVTLEGASANLLDSTQNGSYGGTWSGSSVTLTGSEGVYDAALKKTGISLENGKTYKFTAKIKSTVSRSIVAAIQRCVVSGESTTYPTYKDETIELVANEEKEVEWIFGVSADNGGTANDIYLQMALGNSVEGGLGAHTITFNDMKLEEVTA